MKQSDERQADDIGRRPSARCRTGRGSRSGETRCTAGPGAAVHEIVRQGKRGLEIVKTAGAYDVDLLCAAGCVRAVSAGFVGYETPFGMAPAYRRAVESGEVEAREHACATVIAGSAGRDSGCSVHAGSRLGGSDLPAARGFERSLDPYSGGAVYVVPALAARRCHHPRSGSRPRPGNGRIIGTRFEDVLMAQAARRVILTAERIIDGEAFVDAPETRRHTRASWSMPWLRRPTGRGRSPARRTTNTTPRICAAWVTRGAQCRTPRAISSPTECWRCPRFAA